MTNAVDEWAECNRHVLAFLDTLPDLTVDNAVEFSKKKMEEKDLTVGSRYGTILVSVIDNAKIKELINEADFPRKADVLDVFFNTVRIQAVHNFISASLIGCVDYSALVEYSAQRLEKSSNCFHTSNHKVSVASNVKKQQNVEKTKNEAPAKTQKQSPNGYLLHPLEVISANREFRSIIAEAGIEVRPFEEERLLQRSTVDGNVNYTQVFAQLRHNYTNYDLLRSSRKMRRNTYWKMTVRPAVRVAVCEKLMLLTENEEFHMYLLMQIQNIQNDFVALLMRVASEENFIDAMDEYFQKATSKRVFTSEKKSFMLSLQTL